MDVDERQHECRQSEGTQTEWRRVAELAVCLEQTRLQRTTERREAWLAAVLGVHLVVWVATIVKLLFHMRWRVLVHHLRRDLLVLTTAVNSRNGRGRGASGARNRLLRVDRLLCGVHCSPGDSVAALTESVQCRATSCGGCV